MIENIRLSFQGSWSHKMRSFLTMLGIIIGIAAIISIVSTIKGTNEQIKQNLIGAGNNVVRIQLYHTDYDYVYDVGNEGLPSGVPEISGDTLSAVLELPNVEAAEMCIRDSPQALGPLGHALVVVVKLQGGDARFAAVVDHLSLIHI